MDLEKTLTNNKSFYQWIKECNHYNLKEFIPFVVQEQTIGYIHKNKLEWFLDYPELELSQNQLVFTQANLTFDMRSKIMNSIAKDLLKQKKITSWVGEQYDVSMAYGEDVLFTVERAAATLLGIQKYGVHINAYTIKDGKYFIWVAKRAMDKFTWPGKLDHLVAGGHASGMLIETTMVKECEEEAGMSESLARTATSVGLVNYNQQVNDKLSRDVLFIYDIYVDNDFVPVNTDGEVDEFFLWPIEKVMETISSTRLFKTNCNLVIIDFAIRHGFITPDEPLYNKLVNGLRQQFVPVL